jgi:Flp pilus assembly protein protease CpaA
VEQRSTWNKLRPYAGLPVVTVLYLLLRGSLVSPAVLLLREVLLILGYAAAVKDFREQTVPNRLVLAMLEVWCMILVPQLFIHPETGLSLLFSGAVGALFAGVVFLTVYFVSRKGLGGGDVKLITVFGLYLGLDGVVPTMLYGTLLAAAAGGILIFLKKVGPKDTIPLVPFLYIGVVLTVLTR